MSIMNLFNGGGSVRSEGRSRGSQGRPSLPAPTPAPTWDTEREYNKFQTRANEPGARLAEQWAFDMQRERDQWPWTLDVTREGQPRGQHKREGHWKVKSSNFKPPAMWAANEGQDSGIMTATAATDYSPDFKGRWLLNSPWGHRLLGLITNRHADEGTLEGLDQGGNGGFLGADWDFDIGKNNFGVNATWSLGG